MKKLLVFGFAAVAAVAARASAYNWTFELYDEAHDGMNYYVVNGNNLSAILTDLTENGGKTFNSTMAGLGTNAQAGQFAAGGWGYDAGLFSTVGSGSVPALSDNAYAIILSNGLTIGSDFYYTALTDTTAHQYEPGQTPAGGDISWALSDLSTGKIADAVPEPTSGLLLLLGVAGLALRRRRA